MTRNLVLVSVFGLAISLFLAREASAAPIETDLSGFALGTLLNTTPDDPFETATATDVGTTNNSVFQIGSLYVYVHRVNPLLDNILLFHTGFAVSGFTGVAGWDFTASDSAGGNGDDGDFNTNFNSGVLSWNPSFLWNANAPINFFFISTLPPRTGNYVLYSFDPSPPSLNVGTAQSFAPVPEPGSIALLGAGLAGLYATVRRRRYVER